MQLPVSLTDHYQHHDHHLLLLLLVSVSVCLSVSIHSLAVSMHKSAARLGFAS